MNNMKYKLQRDNRKKDLRSPFYRIELETSFTADETLVRLCSQASGLTEEEAAARLRRYGPNDARHIDAPPALLSVVLVVLVTR